MERRLAAIVALDMVGYSRLMAADEVGVLSRQKDHRSHIIDPSIADHHGRIVKSTGDGVLAEFGSVVDAVGCAVAIQSAISKHQSSVPDDSKIAYRIGINLGDIIIEDGDIYGEGVNIAARLQTLADPGGICVSQTVADHAAGRVACSFEDLGLKHLKNVPQPVRVYAVSVPSAAPARIAYALRRSKFGRRRLVVPVAVGCAAMIGSGIWLHTSGTWPWGDGPFQLLANDEDGSGATAASPNAQQSAVEIASVAVLPFDNLSDEPDQEYFNDGITEDLITELSRFPDLLVISRNSTFRYKGREIDPRTVGDELGATYLLTGSVRRAGDSVRINAQMIDAQSGGYLWAERYDGLLSDIFGLQEQVANRIANALAASLPAQATATRQDETSIPEAYDVLLRGWEHYRIRTPEHQARALEYFQKAVALDPGYARAHAAIAAVYWAAFRGEWIYRVFPAEPDVYERRTKAYDHLAKAMEKPGSLAYQVSAKINLYRGRYQESLADARHAVNSDPNDADASATLAEVLIFSGRPSEAISPIEKAQRLDPYSGSYHSFLRGLVHFGLNEFDEAVVLLERSLELGPEQWSFETGWSYPTIALMASYALSKRKDDAQRLFDQLKRKWPNANFQNELYFWPYKEEADIERLADGLGLAGLPRQ